MDISEFVKKWKSSELKERSGAQEHFLDLCSVLHQPTPATSDSNGAFYTFEKHVSKTNGGKGFADVWFKGQFGWEYKGKFENLDKAYRQLYDYAEDLENPPVLVVCDMENFEVHTCFNNTKKSIFRFNLDDLLNEMPTEKCSISPMSVLIAIFTDVELLRPPSDSAGLEKQIAVIRENYKRTFGRPQPDIDVSLKEFVYDSSSYVVQSGVLDYVEYLYQSYNDGDLKTKKETYFLRKIAEYRGIHNIWKDIYQYYKYYNFPTIDIEFCISNTGNLPAEKYAIEIMGEHIVMPDADSIFTSERIDHLAKKSSRFQENVFIDRIWVVGDVLAHHTPEKTNKIRMSFTKGAGEYVIYWSAFADNFQRVQNSINIRIEEEMPVVNRIGEIAYHY